MIYNLKNNEISVNISDMGAEVVSVKRGDCEYIWQGDPAYWTGHAPILFPICGRLFGNTYTYGDREYTMNLHGFARKSVFDVAERDDTHIVLKLTQNEQTLEVYPFDFELTVTYVLDGKSLNSYINIKNTGDKILPATFGAHPGFNVPLDSGRFEDWYVEFGEDCTPNELIFSDTCFNTGKKRAYELVDSRILPLRHSLFDIDGVFLDRIASSATLKSDVSERYVTLVYPDMPYIGFWHKPQSEAPYVCIEPWCGLPTYDGAHERIDEKNDMFHILSGREKTVNYTLIFG